MDAAGPGPLNRDLPDADARLRLVGLRRTRPRLAVLDLLGRIGGHRGVDEIGAGLERAGTPLPLTTIYNVVHDLTGAGILVVADAGSGRSLYEVADGWHHHFVCRSCGDVVDVPCGRGPKPCATPDLPGVEVDEVSIIFRGRCAACVAAGAGDEA